jgi:1-acyl-sn-glycerol-3-phosphate acyltransferase
VKQRRRTHGYSVHRLSREELHRRSVAASFRHAPDQQRAAMRAARAFRWSDAVETDNLAIGLGGAVIPPQARAPQVPSFDDGYPAPPSVRAPSDIAGRIRALEARLDSLLDGGQSAAPSRAEATDSPPAAPAEDWDVYGDAAGLGPLDDGPATPGEGLDAELTPPEAGDVGEVALADEAAADGPGTDADSTSKNGFFRRQWGHRASRRRAAEVDDFGLDPEFDRRFAQPLLDFLFRRYFRVRVQGVDHVGATGRCLIVANHSGTLPVDGPMLRTAIRLAHPSGRDVRWLSEDFLYYLPFAGTFITRAGAVRACAENAFRLLETDHCVAAFPEGVAGIRKLYRDRYRLQRFGRGGFVRLALRAGAPIVPCAIVGAEETGPMLVRDELLARWVGLPYLPITPTFPWLGPVGLLPAPTRWTIRFGEPLALDEYGPGAAEDDLLVARVGDHVRTTIQRMLDEGLRERKSVWFG